jgi:hypothetical protein
MRPGMAIHVLIACLLILVIVWLLPYGAWELKRSTLLSGQLSSLESHPKIESRLKKLAAHPKVGTLLTSG